MTSRRFLLKALAWSACLVAVTAFSTPVANTGVRVVRSLHVASATLGCDKCQDVGDSHIFSGSGAMFDCMAFNTCHNNWQSGWCANYHNNCQQVEHDDALLLHDNAPVTLARLAEIAASADGRVIAAFLADNADRVQYNADRGVLQLVGCGGMIYAQYPVSESVAAALE